MSMINASTPLDEDVEDVSEEKEDNAELQLTDRFTSPLSILSDKVELLKENDSYLIDNANIIFQPNGKFNAIVNSEVEAYFQAPRKTYALSFDSPTYLTDINFEVVRGDLRGTKIKYFLVNGQEKEVELRKGDDHHSLADILTRIEITFGSAKLLGLKKIELIGYEEKSFASIVRYIKEYYSLTVDLKKIRDEIEEYHHNKVKENKILEDSYQQLQKSYNSQEKAYNNIIQSIEQEQEKLVNIKAILEQAEIKNNKLKTDIRDSTAEYKQLIERVSKEKQELNSIAENKALISQEIKEYIKQSNKDVRAYITLALIPMIIIGAISWFLFSGTYNLSTVFNKNPELNYAIVTHVEAQKDVGKLDSTKTAMAYKLHDDKNIDINAVFWTRLPFVLIVISVLILCYKLAFLFANKIMELHHQRRIFAQIFVLAKEVSDKALESENFTLDEKVNFRTKLKMNMLREHLKNTINLDYNHKLEPSLWIKIMEKVHYKFDEFLTLEDKKEMETALEKQKSTPKRPRKPNASAVTVDDEA